MGAIRIPLSGGQLLTAFGLAAVSVLWHEPVMLVNDTHKKHAQVERMR